MSALFGTYYDLIHGKGKHRETSARRAAVAEIVHNERPLSARQTYYGAVTIGLVPKDVDQKRTSYQKIDDDLVVLRESGIIPFEWITVDETRSLIVWRDWADLSGYLEWGSREYEQNPWNEQDRWTMVLTEDRGTAGSLRPVAAEFHVPITALAGWSAVGNTYQIAKRIHDDGRPCDIVFLGDYDPSGLYIPEEAVAKLGRYIAEHLGGVPDLTLHRLALTKAQASDFVAAGLDHALNPRDSRTPRFIRETGFTTSVELQAYSASDLRDMLTTKLETLLPQDVRDATVERVAEVRRQLTDLSEEYEGWEV